MDCAYAADDSRVCAAAVLLSAGDLSILAAARADRPRPYAYVPGLLGLREGAVSVEAVRALPSMPDLVFCNGHGIAHPRGFGLACLVGLWLDIPTIGVAKGRLRGDDIATEVFTRDGSRPVYVSPGHRVSPEQAVEWALRCTRGSRLPEPLRLAHQAARASVQEASSVEQPP